MFQVRKLIRIYPRNRVRTKTGREGVVGTTSGDVAHVMWDDGAQFPIRFCHLEVIALNVDFPVLTRKRVA